MTDSNTSKTETIWDAIFNRTINSKNLVPFCIIFALTTYLFLGHDSINKRFFILNSLKQEEFAWFSFYALITLASIGITRLCDKLGILKAISLFPVLSDLVYYCILDYREMKDNLHFRVFPTIFTFPIKLNMKICYVYRLLNYISLREGFSTSEPNDYIWKNYSMSTSHCCEMHTLTPCEASEVLCYFILTKHFCHPKHRLNTKEDIKTSILKRIKDFKDEYKQMVSMQPKDVNEHRFFFNHILLGMITDDDTSIHDSANISVCIEIMILMSSLNISLPFEKMYNEDIESKYRFFTECKGLNLTLKFITKEFGSRRLRYGIESRLKLFLKDSNIGVDTFRFQVSFIFQYIFIEHFLKPTQYIEKNYFDEDVKKSHNVIIDMIDQAIKYGILQEEKDGTLFMPRGMVRYFDIIEYGFFYERKYPVLKPICLLTTFLMTSSSSLSLS